MPGSEHPHNVRERAGLPCLWPTCEDCKGFEMHEDNRVKVSPHVYAAIRVLHALIGEILERESPERLHNVKLELCGMHFDRYRYVTIPKGFEVVMNRYTKNCQFATVQTLMSS